MHLQLPGKSTIWPDGWSLLDLVMAHSGVSGFFHPHSQPSEHARVLAGPEGDAAPRPSSKLTVTASDGISLHAEVWDSSSPITVIFCHGYLLDSESWYFQCMGLGARARLVLWDQRGHGKSGWGKPPNATIEQLGQDLFDVLQATAPHGPVVLVGHSMGGMTILGLAESHPEVFGDRVVGTALIGTSAGRLDQITFGLPHLAAPLLHHFIHVGLSLLRRQPHQVLDLMRSSTWRLSSAFTQHYLFAGDVPESAAVLTMRGLSSIPVRVIAEFLTELDSFDKRAALSPLGQVPTLIMVGECDRVTPVSHSRILVQDIAGAQLLVIPGSGHLVTMESPQEVNENLQRLVTYASRVNARQELSKPNAIASARSSAPPWRNDSENASSPSS